MTDTPIRLAGLRGTLASFAVDLFAGRVGCVTDAPMCTGGRDRWGIYDGSAWHLGPASDYAGNSNVLSLAVNGTETIDSARNVSANEVRTGGLLRINSLGDGTFCNVIASGTIFGSRTVTAASSGAGQETNLVADAMAGAYAGLRLQSGGHTRWILRKTNGAENGGDAGSDLELLAFSDGSVPSTVLTVARAAGGVLGVARPVIFVKQVTQWSSEPVTSGRYVKITDTTIGPSATAKTSLLNGGVAAGGFAAVTDPAGRWNLTGAQSDTTLKGKISTVANQVLVFELYRNGAVAATLTIPARTYGTATPWRLVIDQDVRVAGASSTIRVDMRFYAVADNVSDQASCYQMDATLTGINLTAAQSWDVVCTIPNNAANSITCTKAKKVG